MRRIVLAAKGRHVARQARCGWLNQVILNINFPPGRARKANRVEFRRLADDDLFTCLGGALARGESGR